MQEELQTQKDYSLISKNTPLLANLNMCENIAIIKEVHELLSIKKAEELANEYLEKINISHISLQRVQNTNSIDIFYTMLIRALMSKQKNIIIIAMPLIVNDIKYLNDILNNINILNANYKNILILDTITNEHYYKGCLCPIIK